MLKHLVAREFHLDEFIRRIFKAAVVMAENDFITTMQIRAAFLIGAAVVSLFETGTHARQLQKQFVLLFAPVRDCFAHLVVHVIRCALSSILFFLVVGAIRAHAHHFFGPHELRRGAAMEIEHGLEQKRQHHVAGILERKCF